MAAQTGITANLRIAVLDPDGAAIIAAPVQIKDEADRTHMLSTDQSGEALFPALTPGNYHIRVEASGFAPRDIVGFVLKSGSNRVEVRLEVAQVEEQVVVKQDEREKRTDPRGDAFTTIITGDQLADLPDDPAELEATLKRLAGPGAIIRIDGFTGGRLPPKSEIRQIRFRRNSYAAEYHEPGFIGIDVITKPGVSTWHGSIGFSFLDDVLNARNAFAPERSPEQLHRLDLTFSAPLRRDRTSLFLAADVNRSYDAQTFIAALPSGDFAGFVLRPSRSLYASARIAHALSQAHALNFGFQRNALRRENLGVGGFDLSARAYSSDRAENLLRLSETGTLGSRIFNEFRLQARWRNIALQPASEAPAVIVLGAFNTGGAQRRRDDQAREVEIVDNLDFGFSQHAMRAGVLFEVGSYRNESVFNAGGTFTFASLNNFRASLPTTFTQRVGNPLVEFRRLLFGAYWQDDVRIRQNLTVSYGLRYERQSQLADHNNFAPRLGIAWSPSQDGRTTIRGGAGVFYGWFGADTFGDIIAVDGRRQRDIVVQSPGFPMPLLGGTGIILPPSRLQLDPQARNPYVIQSSLSVERQVTRQLYLTTSYLYQRGMHLLRGHDINAPVLGLERPDPAAGNIVQVESSANSTRHLLDITANNLLSKRLYWFINYSLSKTIDEADSPFSLPADNLNLRDERGPAAEDARHRLNATVGLQLLKGLRLGTTFYANSALPYDITTGNDDNGDTVFNDRPAGVTRNSARGTPQWDVSMRLSWLIAFGDARGTSRAAGGPRTVSVSSSDVGALSSELAASEKRWRINLYLQAFNLLNHVNLINYTGVMTSPFFGQATAAPPGRRIETGMRFSF
ncbi:MAG: TonB-dependent receptor [Acidobacteria bacterium]|nr:TonB-dependent receptor [Acidobacteriota bacterium]